MIMWRRMVLGSCLSTQNLVVYPSRGPFTSKLLKIPLILNFLKSILLQHLQINVFELLFASEF